MTRQELQETLHRYADAKNRHDVDAIVALRSEDCVDHAGGTLTGELMGVAVEAGRRIEIPCAFVCTFRDGLLVEDLQYFDAATLAEQLGLPLEAISERTTGLEPATSSLGSSRSTG
jgi:hypothetical protein